MRGRGAPMTYRSPMAPSHANERIAPSNREIKAQTATTHRRLRSRWMVRGIGQCDAPCLATRFGPMWGYRCARERHVRVDGALEQEPPTWLRTIRKWGIGSREAHHRFSFDVSKPGHSLKWYNPFTGKLQPKCATILIRIGDRSMTDIPLNVLFRNRQTGEKIEQLTAVNLFDDPQHTNVMLKVNVVIPQVIVEPSPDESH